MITISLLTIPVIKTLIWIHSTLFLKLGFTDFIPKKNLKVAQWNFLDFLRQTTFQNNYSFRRDVKAHITKFMIEISF